MVEERISEIHILALMISNPLTAFGSARYLCASLLLHLSFLSYSSFCHNETDVNARSFFSIFSFFFRTLMLVFLLVYAT